MNNAHMPLTCLYATIIKPSVGLPQVSFPLPKLDLVAIPNFAAGAMENWGLLTYRERALLVDDSKDDMHQRYAIATTVAHETVRSASTEGPSKEVPPASKPVLCADDRRTTNLLRQRTTRGLSLQGRQTGMIKILWSSGSKGRGLPPCSCVQGLALAVSRRRRTSGLATWPPSTTGQSCGSTRASPPTWRLCWQMPTSQAWDTSQTSSLE